MSPEAAEQAIVDLIEFIMANSSHTPNVLGNMTLPQVNAIAEAIRRFRIHAWGIGLEGDKKDAPKAEREHTREDAMAFIAQFNGL